MQGKIFNTLPTLGGSVGAGVGAWIHLNHDMLVAAIVSAAIFALVGGVVGYLVHLFMKWITKKVLILCKKL